MRFISHTHTYISISIDVMVGGALPPFTDYQLKSDFELDFDFRVLNS